MGSLYPRPLLVVDFFRSGELVAIRGRGGPEGPSCPKRITSVRHAGRVIGLLAGEPRPPGRSTAPAIGVYPFGACSIDCLMPRRIGWRETGP
jgi:hypothetical protein